MSSLMFCAFCFLKINILYYLYNMQKCRIRMQGCEFMLELTVGELVKKRRSELGLTQAKLAEMINADPYYISKIETGSRKPGNKYLKALANALQVPCDYLLGLGSDVVLHEHISDMEKVLQSLSEEDRELMIKWFYEFAEKCKTKE